MISLGADYPEEVGMADPINDDERRLEDASEGADGAAPESESDKPEENKNGGGWTEKPRSDDDETMANAQTA